MNPVVCPSKTPSTERSVYSMILRTIMSSVPLKTCGPCDGGQFLFGPAASQPGTPDDVSASTLEAAREPYRKVSRARRCLRDDRPQWHEQSQGHHQYTGCDKPDPITDGAWARWQQIDARPRARPAWGPGRRQRRPSYAGPSAAGLATMKSFGSLCGTSADQCAAAPAGTAASRKRPARDRVDPGRSINHVLERDLTDPPTAGFCEI